MAADITVIGIDPGSQNTGWGVVREVSVVLSLVDCGVIRTGAARGAVFSERLACIYRELSAVLVRLCPQEAAVEQVFTAHNAATALKLGQARGVAVAACAAQGIGISDYEPTLVEKNHCGAGRQKKNRCNILVARLLQVKNPQWALDTSDALALLFCHLTLRRYAQWATQTKGK